MPLEIRVDVVPGGHEQARQTLHTVRITQIQRLDDDPGGERIYQVEERPSPRKVRIRHHRRDGVEILAARALSAYFDQSTGRP